MSGISPAPEPSAPQGPSGGAPPRAWWRTRRGRAGLVAAVPLLGLVAPALGAVMVIVAVVALWRGSDWPRSVRIAATAGVMGLLGAVIPDPPDDRTAVAGPAAVQRPPTAALPPAPSPSRQPGPEVRDFRGKSLEIAFGRSRKAGFSVTYHDASDERREIAARSLWTVCFQKEAGTDEDPAVDFAAVRTGDPCPARDGGPLPLPAVPELVGKTWRTARAEVVALGVPAEDVRARAAYRNDTLPEEGEYDHWRVCAHDPSEGGRVRSRDTVTLYLSSAGNGCPEPDRGAGTAVDLPDRDGDGDPDYRDPHPGDRDRTSSFPNGLPRGTDGSGGSGDGGGWNPCRKTRWC